MLMKVNTQSVNLMQTLIEQFIQKRMDKLELFYDKVIKSDVFLKGKYKRQGEQNY